MFVQTQMSEENVLLIIAYTFSEREWSALAETAIRAGIRPDYSPLGRDQFGREGRRYYADTPEQIASLGRILRGNFDRVGRFEPAPGVGRRYACREVRHSGVAKGCEEFDAEDDNIAIVRCGIIASQNGWFGGDARQGNCGPPGRLARMFR